uniref:Uncharacterized protein n=1 Tax=Romanomermis culicivorax TaxID=13658 RepID=A0A915HKA8_ROMCU
MTGKYLEVVGIVSDNDISKTDMANNVLMPKFTLSLRSPLTTTLLHLFAEHLEFYNCPLLIFNERSDRDVDVHGKIDHGAGILKKSNAINQKSAEICRIPNASSRLITSKIFLLALSLFKMSPIRSSILPGDANGRPSKAIRSSTH